MTKMLVYWALNRLKEPSTWAAAALAALTYFGFQVLPDCTGVDKCISEDLWGKIIEAGSYIIVAILVFMKEKKSQDHPVNVKKDATPEYPEVDVSK